MCCKLHLSEIGPRTSEGEEEEPEKQTVVLNVITA